MTTYLYQMAAHIFPWNNWVAESLIEDYGVPRWKVTPVSPGVDTDLYHPDPSARKSDGVVRILFVGGDFHRKGGDMLARWCAQTKVKTPCEVHIVTRDHVDVPGAFVHQALGNNSAELVRLYQSCDIFALPTRADCYSLVALEAMASGMPVIISRLGGIPEIVADGLTGYLIDPADYGTFSDSLDRLVKNPSLREQMGAAARKRAVEEFDCRANISRILNIMKAGPATAPTRRVRPQAPNPVAASLLDEELDDITTGRVSLI